MAGRPELPRGQFKFKLRYIFLFDIYINQSNHKRVNTINAFEKKLRESDFASLSDARIALKSHPLLGDYLLELLVERGVLAVAEDGRVVGGNGLSLEPKALRRGPNDGGAVKPWGEKWPPRERLLALIDSVGGHLRQIKECLAGENLPCGHWLTLNALWNLQREGLVEKSEEIGYFLSERGKKVVAALPKPEEL